jgi:hypothetical protein
VLATLNHLLTVQDSGSEIKVQDLNGGNITLPSVFSTGVEYHFSTNADLNFNTTITATGGATIVGLVYRCGNQLRIGSGITGVTSLKLIGNPDVDDKTRMSIVDHLELRAVGSTIWVARGMFSQTGIEPVP